MATPGQLRQAARLVNDAAHPEVALPARRPSLLTDELALRLWKLDDDLRQTSSAHSFEAAARRLIGIARRRTATPADVEQALTRIRAAPLVMWDVMRPLLGATTRKRRTLSFGKTEVWRRSALQRHLIETHGADAENILGNFPGLVLRSRVAARDSHLAFELADHALTEFESIMRYLRASPRRHEDLGVFSHQPASLRCAAAISSTGIHSGTQIEGAITPFDLDDERLRNDLLGDAAELWDLHAKAERTHVENKILTAVHWASRARRDEDPARSVVQSWFAIEAALPCDQAESVVAQIADFAALLLSVRAADRPRHRRRVRNLYDTRCDIAHGRRHNASTVERQDALRLAESIISNMLSESIRTAQTREACAAAIRQYARP